MTSSLVPEFNRVHGQVPGLLCKVSVGDVLKGMYNLAASVAKAVANLFSPKPRASDTQRVREYDYDNKAACSEGVGVRDLNVYHLLSDNSREVFFDGNIVILNPGDEGFTD